MRPDPRTADCRHPDANKVAMASINPIVRLAAPMVVFRFPFELQTRCPAIAATGSPAVPKAARGGPMMLSGTCFPVKAN